MTVKELIQELVDFGHMEATVQVTVNNNYYEPTVDTPKVGSHFEGKQFYINASDFPEI